MIPSPYTAIKEFLSYSKQNQVIILLLGVIAAMGYERQANIKIKLEDARVLHYNDSIRDLRDIDRENAFKKALEECNEARINESKESTQKYREDLKKIFFLTDKAYHNQ